MNFNDLNLSNQILKSLKKINFNNPTEIQNKVIPLAKQGFDIIGQAQTGTGKTAAFAIPIIEQTDSQHKIIQHLILAPTRELASQIADQFQLLIQDNFDIRIGVIIGGLNYEMQRKVLQNKPHILIATPGRLFDLLTKKEFEKKVDLSKIKTLTLDEADELLKVGFYEQIKDLLDFLPLKRQNFFFTATFDKKTENLSKLITKNAKNVFVSEGKKTTNSVEQEFVVLKEKNKFISLIKFLEFYQPKSVVIFGRTKRRVDELTEALKSLKFKALGIQGDLPQKERNKIIDIFRKREIKILVATDVMARGIDVEHVEWVINFDLPQEIEYYTHRIGRTGRAGKTGYSLSFVKPDEILHLEKIAIDTCSNIKEILVPSEKDLKQTWNNKIWKKFEKILAESNELIKTPIRDDLLGKFNKLELATLLADYISKTKKFEKNIKLTPEPSVIIKINKNNLKNNINDRLKNKKSKNKKNKFLDKKINKSLKKSKNR
ncbi:DEAD/DEAH box helicase [[Mycoplasma] collis]|uniref:DEAD/DEAH box helicase n=1 Tax=[Mycoplasma] collis TaxID=2127 RepID=UPI00069117CA|nr:DEAD/DEAH box helicase [[Mycoplasma] collis]